jgi:hypothetical protein
MNPAATPIAWFWQIWLAAVVFVFPLPGTIALRNLLLLVGLLALLATLRGTPRPRPPHYLRPAAWGLVAITAWLAWHSVAVAPTPTLALGNLRGDWIVPLLTAALAAYASARLSSRQTLLAAAVALAAHIIWVIGWQAWRWSALPQAGWPAGFVPVGERDIHSTLAAFLLALTLGERLLALLAPKAALLSARAGWALLALALIGDVMLRARNGTLVALVLLLLTVIIASRRVPRLRMLLVAVALLAGASITLDKRWSGMTESLDVGWNSSSPYWHTWNEADRPQRPSGAALEESAYARAAWAHEAIKAIAENPLGLGFGRDSFGRAVEMKYGYKGMVSSHSGWLDFALAVGLPGLVLLLLTAGLAIRGGWRQFRDHDDPAGLMLSFLVGSYLLRCLLDGHFSGWRLGLFAFICGALVAAMKPAPRSA